MITPEIIEVAARAMFEARHKGLANCYPWDDTDLDHDHPDCRPSLYRDAVACLAAVAPLLVAGEREACAKIFDDEQRDARSQIAENIAYTRRIGRGDDLWSPSNELCRNRAEWNERAAAAIRARANIDATPAETRRVGE